MSDVFISYAHIDNEPFGEEQARWVTEFAENLRKRLGMVAGEAADVWRDPRLQGNDAIWPAIEAAVAEAAALVSVVSPRYVKSDACLREIALFVQKKGLARNERRKPLFKVVKTHVPREQHPEPLRDVNGYEFYEEDRAAHRFREFGLHPDPQVKRLYWTRLDDLAQDIGTLLETEQPRPAARPEPVRVYVAQTTRDVREAREAIARELKDRGVEVLPVGDLPPSADELRTAVRADLEGASFSVHIVGARDGFVPEGDTRSVVELQYALALETRTPGLLWCPAGVEPPPAPGTSASTTLANRLATSAIPENGFDFLRGTLNEVKALLLTRLAEPPPPASVAPDPGVFNVYLVYLRKESARMEALEADLARRWRSVSAHAPLPSLRCSGPIDRGTPAQLRVDHEGKLGTSDAVVIVCADAPREWVTAKLTELTRSGLAGEAAPRGIFYVPPDGVALAPFPVASSVDDLLAFLGGMRRR